jgi:hypothetical protein
VPVLRTKRDNHTPDWDLFCLKRNYTTGGLSCSGMIPVSIGVFSVAVEAAAAAATRDV